jgi:exodeoxyribonuclease VII small subunit
MAKKKITDEVEQCFEDSLKELETIVAKLEGGKLGLEDSLEQYERGVAHLKQCYQQLRHAERRIELVSNLDASGKAQTVPFDEEDDDSLTGKADARTRRRTSAPAKPGKRPAASEVDDESSLF